PVLEVLPVTVVAPPTPVPPVTPAASPAVMPVLPLAALLLESPGPLVSEPSGLEHAPQSASMMMTTEARDSRRVRSGEIRIFCMVLPLPVNGGPATCRNAEFERSTTHGKSRGARLAARVVHHGDDTRVRIAEGQGIPTGGAQPH